ncbi:MULTISPECIES: hypothetical protein [Pseudarthrobacter]|jgi:hypothetical protein|uniref:hypothetical protein n=1 Tax=Pseudarthrobacter TaxID=1742993 RepID=UPI00157300A4|nr:MULTISPECIES: hypothetical protein [Pseudarthrobacter]MDV2977818.1 hypothetical protein [Actinomycetes bacterium ARC8]NSX38693.1 hypothetical protein [Pseudarthrobacter oxydans]BFE42518.1 hypothetical protein GCM10017547_04110 [Pseudarthrobacter oxydans]GKV74638.1 hypothetical protein NCCP2145_40190 [Pseudarthrobacter sp. NCCP-2145]
MSGRAISGIGSQPRLTLGRWPFTPTDDLMKLRETLQRSLDIARLEATEKLLEQIDQELRQRARNPLYKQVNGTERPL